MTNGIYVQYDTGLIKSSDNAVYDAKTLEKIKDAYTVSEEHKTADRELADRLNKLFFSTETPKLRKLRVLKHSHN
jgi:hypothetical protein